MQAKFCSHGSVKTKIRRKENSNQKKKKLKILGKAFVYLSHLFTQKKGGAFIRGKECLTLFTMIDSFSG